MSPTSKTAILLADDAGCFRCSWPNLCRRVVCLVWLVALTLVANPLPAQQTWESTPAGAGAPDGMAALPGWPGTVPAESDTASPGQPARIAHADFMEPIPELPDWNDPTVEASGDSISANAPANGWQTAVHRVRDWMGSLKGPVGNVDIRKVFGSLAIVLGSYFGLVWLLRRIGKGGWGGLPSEVVEVLGHAPFGPRKNLQLVRLGPKLLLLLHGPEGTRTIGEIDDPGEVAHLRDLCNGQGKSRRPASRSPVNTSESITIPARELENVVKQLAGHAQRNSSNVFEA